METVETLIAFCRENDRVCPKPKEWDRLWHLLPDRKRVGVGWEPPPPLILAAWDGPAISKMLRLAEHIQWAAGHNALGFVGSFLRNLSEQEWHHVGE